MSNKLSCYPNMQRSRIVTAVVALLISSPALAQNFKVLPLGGGQTWSQITLSPEAKAVAEMLSGAQPMNQATFDKFFNEMMFPLFAQYEPFKQGAKMINPLLGGAGALPPAVMRSQLQSRLRTKGHCASPSAFNGNHARQDGRNCQRRFSSSVSGKRDDANCRSESN